MKIKSELNPTMKIRSRYELPGEYTELEHFVTLLDTFELSPQVRSILYDSGANCAFYELVEMPAWLRYVVGTQVDRLADIALSQFEDSTGRIAHGAPMALDGEVD